MTGTSFLFMIFSWGLVLMLATYCFSKLFAVNGRKNEKKDRN